MSKETYGVETFQERDQDLELEELCHQLKKNTSGRRILVNVNMLKSVTFDVRISDQTA